MKQEVRRAVRERKNTLTAKQKSSADEFIYERVFPFLAHARTICIYVSLPDEVDTKKLIGRLLTEGKTIVVPRVSGEMLTLHHIRSIQDLTPGPHLIAEPTQDIPAIEPADVDIFVVPGVAFDTNGFRVGRGKGYYDKLLTGLRAKKIGLAYEFQVLAEVPQSTYDVGMDVVITERNYYGKTKTP